VHAPARARLRLRPPAQLAWLRALRLQGADVERGSARARRPALALQAQGVAVIQFIRPEADNSSGDWSVAGRVCAQCCARTPRCCLDSATRGAAQANAPTWLPHTRLLRGLEVQVLAKLCGALRSLMAFAALGRSRHTRPPSPQRSRWQAKAAGRAWARTHRLQCASCALVVASENCLRVHHACCWMLQGSLAGSASSAQGSLSSRKLS